MRLKTISKVIIAILSISLAVCAGYYYYDQSTYSKNIIQLIQNNVKTIRKQLGLTYGDDLPFELGNISYGEDRWIYLDSNSFFRLPKGHELELKKGDGIMMESGDYQYRVGIQTSDGRFTASNWINGANGYVAPFDGKYSIVIKHNSVFNKHSEQFIKRAASSLRIYDNHNEAIKTHLFQDNNVYTAGHCSGGSSKGSPQNVPENSIQGLEYYASQGYWGSECDVRITADGEWILCHDATIDRTTDQSGRVHDYTLAELQSFKLRKNETRSDYCMPWLNDWLDACKRLGMIPVIEIEFDASIVFEEHVKKIVDALKERGMEKDAVIISFSYTPLYWVKKYCRSIVTLFICYECPVIYSDSIPDQDFANLAVYGNAGMFASQNNQTYPITAERSADAHSYGLYVGTWTSYPSTRANTVKVIGYNINLCGAETCPNVLDLLPY